MENEDEGGIINRQCRKCGVWKDLAEFYYRTDQQKHRYECKTCTALTVKNSPYQTSEQRELKRRNAAYRRKYGISLGQYEKILQDQAGCCALCGDEQQGETTKHLFVDHDHITGEVRGLLCRQCNTRLGLIDDLGIEHVTDYLEGNLPWQIFRQKNDNG